MKVLSLGAGVQSSTMALMAASGELEMPDCAIFADTGWEPKAVYEWLDILESKVPYPIHRVNNGNIKDDVINGINSKGNRFISIPFYIKKKNGQTGLARRQCTREYKIMPLRQEIRKMGASHKKPAELWIGISVDEIIRMKDSDVKYLSHRWPLVERRMTRVDCMGWLEAHGYDVPPKSACLGCPMRPYKDWDNLANGNKVEWNETVLIDAKIRRLGHMNEELYMSQTLEPLSEIDFRREQEMGQLDLFLNECEGMCGV